MRRLLLVIGVLAVAILAIAGLVGSPSAHAADEPDPIRVTLTRVAPSVLTETGSLLVSGHIANASFTSYTDVMVQLRMGASPLDKREQIARVSAGNGSWDGDPIGGSLVTVASELGPGGHASFRIEVPVSSLPVTDPGVYSLGVEVIASDGNAYDRRGIQRLVIPWMPIATEVSPVRIAWLWPLADAPSRDARGVLLGTQTADELSPGGRLRNLVEIGAKYRADVSWIVDPELLQTAKAMSTGYLVDIDGKVQPGTRAAQAGSWLEMLSTATARGAQSTTWALPYADVDADALLRNGLSNDLVRAVGSAPTIAQSALGRPVLGSVEWAASGNLDTPTLDELASIGMRVVIMRDSSVPADDTTVTPSGTTDLATPYGSVRAVLLDTGLRETLSLRQQTMTQSIVARERFLSELAFVALELPTIPRTLIAGPSSPRWKPSGTLVRSLLRDVHTTWWIDPVSLETVVAEPPSQMPRTRAPYDQQAHELPGYYLQRIVNAQENLAQIAGVLSDPATVTDADFATLLRAESSTWRFHTAGGSALIDSVEASVAQVENGVRILNRDDVILSGDTGSVPVTLANELDQAVTVGVRLVGTPSARLDANPLTGITIEPGKRASVVVPVRIVGSDSVDVRVEILDAKGQTFGTSSTMALRTTAYSRAARWFTIGAAILLMIMVVFDIYRRVRNARRNRAAAAATVREEGT